MTLVEFLTARLDEDEATATRAQGERDYEPLGVLGNKLRPEPAVYHVHPFQGWVATPPRRVLREVEAKRRIIQALVDQQALNARFTVAPLPDVAAVTEGAWTAVAYCLASVYADHPDYDDAWRVD